MSWQPLPTAVYCQSMNAGTELGIMNMLGGLTSPWLNVWGFLESSSWIQAKECMMASPAANASGGSSRARRASRVSHFFWKRGQYAAMSSPQPGWYQGPLCGLTPSAPDARSGEFQKFAWCFATCWIVSITPASSRRGQSTAPGTSRSSSSTPSVVSPVSVSFTDPRYLRTRARARAVATTRTRPRALER